MSSKRIRILKKYNGCGRHKKGEILHCIHCGVELIIGIDDIVSKMVQASSSHTIYYCLHDAKELNIL